MKTIPRPPEKRTDDPFAERTVARSIEELSEECALVTLPEAVRSWKEQTRGKAIGAFPVYVPEELVHAGGGLPVAVRGGGAIDTDRSDSRIQSFICSIAKTTLELGFRGELDVLDGMIFPNICDVSKNLCGVWKRNFPDRYLEYIHFPQNPISHHSVDYLKREFERVRAGLNELLGVKIADDQIRKSIRVFNEHRELLQRIYDIRRENPWRLKASEADKLIRAGRFLTRERHSGLLREALQALADSPRRPRDGLRVILEGAFCEPPPSEFLDTLEDAGCFIVDDDLNLAPRWFEAEVETAGDPLAALAQAYLRHSVSSSIRHGGALPRSEAVVAKARRARAVGVICAAAKFCEPALFDYPLIRTALEREQIPYLSLEFDEKMSSFENARSQAETFVEASLFFS